MRFSVRFRFRFRFRGFGFVSSGFQVRVQVFGFGLGLGVKGLQAHKDAKLHHTGITVNKGQWCMKGGGGAWTSQ